HDAYLKKDGTYPLIVIVTDDMENAIIEKDFSDFRFAFPESDLFYHLQPFGHLIPHSLANNPKTPVSNPPPLQLSHEVYAYPGKEQPKAWLPVSTGGDIVLQQTVFDIKDEEIIQGNWATGLLLQGKVMSQALHPDRADREWLDLVKYSFNAHVMIPYTSFMVVENEAQKAMLEKKQAQALAGHKNLDAGENTRQMSEPGLIFLVLLTLLLWSVKNRAWLKRFWGPPLGVGLSALAGRRHGPFRAQTDASIPGPTRTKD
ncbi:MAG: MSEP-CTERM sorting domain-containing protein, partial [Cyclobacteriaceae bacterium]|nr:MSEP-CTERM sorting domain-containing protein [Cyclobacteriaceae bacterium]